MRSGVRDDRLVYQASIFPTLCALTGVPMPSTVEFPSLIESGDDDPAFLAYRHLQRGLRTRRWSLIAYAPARRIQLFDLIADPWQTRDLAADPAYGDTLRRLLAALRRRQGELDDPSGGWVDQIDESWHRPEDSAAGRTQRRRLQ
ncbi:hypothetical protein E1286_04635 [Nonomuraea terrae]|uniref:DUF4976 domain-containing protein n=1 Tax=Nonomuraea terrae TaxID=2530383 RepID=A0A4R4Z9H0_9ACTN|nr:hypothetical protein [Nonomuraea terrae]TDD54991.1 hypothetical protein E1286_04635 [Nonomuraea terrae]